MNDSPETVETSAWTNRELMLRTYYQVVETNGSTRQHHLDLYGDPARGQAGIKQTVEDNRVYRERLTIQVRIALAIGGTVATLLTALLVVIVERLL